MSAAAATGSASTQLNDSTGIHRYKLAPPLFDGDYSKYEDWKHKFIAYMALQHADYTKLLKSSEAATTVLTDADLQTSAQDDDEARRWTSMSRDLHYILINICSGSAATVVRQQGVVGDNNGFETFRVLHQRFSLPVGTRSIGYLTTLLKPKFEEQSFEENFLQWEYDVARYELDNGQALPDTVKIAILLNETKGALQQHLQLRAGQVTTYAAMRSIVVEYYRATTTLSKLKMMHNPSTNNYNGPQPMDIGMTWKGYKGKGKGKYKGKNNKGRGKGYKGKSKGKMTGKGKDTGKGYGGSYGQTGKGKGKDYNGGKDNSKGKGKGSICYKCNRAGHFARDCRMPIYQIQQQDDYNHDATYDWYNGSYDNSWYSYNFHDQQQVIDTNQQPAIVDTSQQQAPATTGQQLPITYKIGTVKETSVLMVGNTHTYQSTSTNVNTDKDVLLYPPTQDQLTASTTQQLPIAPTEITPPYMHMDVDHILVDSGAATHVCPKDYATQFPLEPLGASTPQLFTATDDPIKVYGIRRVYYKCQGQPVVIPYFACDVKYPIISVSRLVDRGYDLYWANTGTILRGPSLRVTLKRDGNLFYLPAEQQPLEEGWKIHIITTPDGQEKFQIVQQQGINFSVIAPTSTTATGSRPIMGGNTDIWIVRGNYVIRVHKRLRRAKFTPENTQCPVPTEQLDEWRQTTVRRPGQEDMIYTDNYPSVEPKFYRELIPGEHWKGETTFRLKTTATGQQLRSTSTTSAGQQTSNATPRTRATMKRAPTVEEQHVQAPSKARITQGRKSATPPTAQQANTTSTPMVVLNDEQDYWERRGTKWIRHHLQQRRTLFIPIDGPGHPPTSTLEPYRTTHAINIQTDEVSQIKDEWSTTDMPAELQYTWKGTTTFTLKDEFETTLEDVVAPPPEHPDTLQEARRARGRPQPTQPTKQEMEEHALTHMPYRSWCPICVKAKGKQDAYKQQQSKQPVIQIDFAYLKTSEDEQSLAVLTAVDVQSQLCMALAVPNKAMQHDYMIKSLSSFILECGRTSGIIQCDNEPTLKTVATGAAAKIGNITVRQTPTYSSNSQGSVERFHRTLFGQVKSLREQVKASYNNHMIGNNHPLMPWMIRHAAWLINRYLIHSDGLTSYQRRWERDYKHAICEFGETVLYRVPAKQLVKGDLALHKAIWLGVDDSNGESFVGTTEGVIRARTIRRLQQDFKYDEQLLNQQHGTPWAPKHPTQHEPAFALPLPEVRPSMADQATSTDAEAQQQLMSESTPRPGTTTARLVQHSSSSSPMATSSTADHSRPLLPTPTRPRTDEATRHTKQQRTDTATEATAATNTTEVQEPPPTRQRVAAYTYKIASVTLADHTTKDAVTNDDLDEQAVVTRLQHPIIHDREGFDEEKLQKGMNKEMEQMKKHDVYEEVSTDNVDQETLHNAIDSRWVHKNKTPTEVRSRIVAKGYKEEVEDLDDIYASTPLFVILRVLLTVAMARSWRIRLGDVSTAFLHAPLGNQRVYIWPPKEYYPEGTTLWRLKKAMYGLRSSPKAWQDYFATSMSDLGFKRLLSEANVYANSTNDVYIMVYVDDIMVIGDPTKVNKIFEKIQEKMLLKHIGYLDPGEKHYFLGRQIHNEGNYFDIKLDDDYIEAILQEVNMTKCNPAPTPGTAANKSTFADSEPLTPDQHKVYRRVVGKLQWLSFTRPDISYSTKELARGLHQPTEADWKKAKHLLRYLRGTGNYTQQLRPTTTLNTSKAVLDMDIHVDADWAGCPSTRKSTTGFVIYILGTPVSFGSRTQATIALSSAESELYAICTGTSEGLHLKMFLQESGLASKVNIRIHTDSTAGKSIATRQGTSKKAKHIDIRFLYTQQLTKDGIISIHKISTTRNTADILTKYISRETLQRLLYAAGLHART